MVHFQIYSWTVVFLMIACHVILLAEGRQIRSLKNEQVPTQTQKDGISDQKAVTAFRPTTPGNSPGAGHSFTEHGLDFVSEAVSNVDGIPQPTAESENGFRPTKPGNSPGAGHSIHNQTTKPKA
ncbi:hypothetical protein OSB04_000502 [Centaurea solstitialis]|uniref:Uncharacterized protein n=1 Tax=Centaurea solstitialis TaxID=347529 RepID=A0AA38TZR2_9ASTR|nr:hypothetical protein OSB04_000502 [Centaurea solstitialis]